MPLKIQNLTPGGQKYIGAAVSYRPDGTPITAPASAPTAAGSGSGGTLAAATYRYKVTYVGGTPSGETTPSAATTGYVASGTTSSVALTAIPTGGTGTTARKIYRSTDGTNYYLLKTIANNTSTTYTDTGADTITGQLPPTENTTNIGAPGTFPGPTEFVPVTDDSLKGDFDFAEPKVMRSSLYTDAVMEPDRIDPMGDLGLLFNGKLGTIFFHGGIGAYVDLDAITTATTGPATTQNGITSFPCPTSLAFEQGALIDINTGSSMEEATVAGYDPATGILQARELKVNANALSGITIVQGAQRLYDRALLTGALQKRMPLLCVEDASGAGDWSLAYGDIAVDGLDFTFASKETKCKVSLVGMQEPLYYNRNYPSDGLGAVGATTQYNPNLADEIIALQPFTSRRAYVLAGGDPDATGSSIYRAALGATNVQVTLKNALQKLEPMNDTGAYLYAPSGNAECTFTFDELQTDQRNAVFYDYIKRSLAVPFNVASWKNFGTLASPAYKGVSIFLPNVKYKTATSDAKTGSVDSWKKAGKALALPGADQTYMRIFTRS